MKIIILVGPPGSGKSSFANKYPSYVRINQDELGDRNACIKLFRESMLQKKSVIIDRCNINKMQRGIWIQESLKYNVTEISAIYLYVNPKTCIERINNRKNHPTIKNDDIEKNTKIMENFTKSFESPDMEEGFDKILIIKNE